MKIIDTDLCEFLIKYPNAYLNLTLNNEGESSSAMKNKIAFYDNERRKDILVSYLIEDNNIIGWIWSMDYGSQDHIMLYVCKNHRRKGYGTNLVKHMKKRVEEERHKTIVLGSYWDTQSSLFFGKLHITPF